MANMNGITRKQAGVIYGANKRGQMSLTAEEIGFMYDRFVVDNIRPTTDAHSAEVAERAAMAVEFVFAGKYTEAEEALRGAIAAFNRYWI